MFEIKAIEKVNEHLRTVFPTIGYRLFRQLGGAPILVADDAQQPLDGYELNLFAAKSDRARVLSQQGFLVDAVPAWVPSADICKVAELFWRSQKFASVINLPNGNGTHTDSAYRNSLAAYATWRVADQPIATRVAALAFALHGLRAACARAPTAERLSSFARVAWEWGARAESVAVLQRLLQGLQGCQIRLSEPFWPAHPRFDSLSPGSQPANWFVGAAAEQFEQTFSFSSIFAGASPVLPWLCTQPFASTEMERRLMLVAARAGQRPVVPGRLCQVKLDHLNADIWRAGKVPGTIAGPYQPASL
jgi:hypothetical protein